MVIPDCIHLLRIQFVANSLSKDKITGRLCFQFTVSLRMRDRSLVMEKQKSLETLKTAEMSGLVSERSLEGLVRCSQE